MIFVKFRQRNKKISFFGAKKGYFFNVKVRFYTGCVYMYTGSQNTRKKGFTLIEVMVVITIIGIISTIAVPTMFGLVEKSREKIDLLKFFYLKDALNRALVENEAALYNSAFLSEGSAEDQKKNHDKLTNALKGKGVALFVIEVHNGLSINIQGSHGSANNDVNMCQLIGSGGAYYNALNEAGFEGVADIVAARLNPQKGKDGKLEWQKEGNAFTSISYWSDKFSKTDYRTAPKKTLFISKALNVGKVADNTRYTVNIRWTNGDEKSKSIEVFLLPNNVAWDGAFRTDNGVCFSTIGYAGCASYVDPFAPKKK